MKSLISVIVPVYKVESYLDDCVVSLINQSYKNLEIILVDDGSPDNCPKMCDNWAEKDNRIKVIHKKNGGLSSARNAGLDIAKGDYIAFVDSDDFIILTMYEKMIRVLNNNDVDFVACKVNCFIEKTKTFKPFMEGHDFYKITKDQIIQKEQYQKLILSTQIESAAWNKLYKKSFINKLRFKEKRYYEDYLFIYQLSKFMTRMYYMAQPFYNYRIRENSICTSLNHLEDWEKNFTEIKYDLISNKDLNLLDSLSLAEIRFHQNACKIFVNNDELFDYHRRQMKDVNINKTKLSPRLLIKYIICIKSKHLFKMIFKQK